MFSRILVSRDNFCSLLSIRLQVDCYKTNEPSQFQKYSKRTKYIFGLLCKQKVILWHTHWLSLHVTHISLAVFLFVLLLYVPSQQLWSWRDSGLFVGHVQTVQAQIRRRTTRRLIKVFTVCLQNFRFKFGKR